MNATSDELTALDGRFATILIDPPWRFAAVRMGVADEILGA